MGSCPNSTESGCRCPDHAPGLMAHAKDIAAYEAALRTVRPTTLHVVTFGDRDREPVVDPTEHEEPCVGGYTCPCSKCADDRAKAVRRGVRRLPNTYQRDRAA